MEVPREIRNVTIENYSVDPVEYIEKCGYLAKGMR